MKTSKKTHQLAILLKGVQRLGVAILLTFLCTQFSYAQKLDEYYCTGDGYLFDNPTWLNGRIGYERTTGKLYVSTPNHVYESKGRTFFGADLYTNSRGVYGIQCEGRSFPIEAQITTPNGRIIPAELMISDYDGNRSLLIIKNSISLKYEEFGRFIVNWTRK